MSLILYGTPVSPFLRKTDAFLREKGAEPTIEAVNIFAMPDWFLEISPARRIPVLRDTGIGTEGSAGTIPDSSAICAWAEHRFPEPPLYPGDPFEHGRAVWIEEYCDNELAAPIGFEVFRPIQLPRFQGQEPDLETARRAYAEKLPRPLDYLEGELAGRPFLVGEALSIADIAAVSQIAQLELVAGPLDAERWPGLAGLTRRLSGRASFAACLAACRNMITHPPVDLRR